tara:strand:- start:1940 stop:2320 length:381 start_codon:yes stop_codon:yes gene_type:complete
MKRKKYKFKFYPNVPKMVLNWLGDRGIEVDTTCSCCQQSIKIKCAVIECPTIGRWLFIENLEEKFITGSYDGLFDVDIYHMEGIEAEVIDTTCFHFDKWENPKFLYDKAEDIFELYVLPCLEEQTW